MTAHNSYPEGPPAEAGKDMATIPRLVTAGLGAFVLRDKGTNRVTWEPSVEFGG